MRGIAVSLLLTIGLAAPAMADIISVLRENTLVLRTPEGRMMALQVREGRYGQQVNTKGREASFFWGMSERGFCWTARGEAEVCIPMPADEDVGGSWEIKGPTGQLVWTAEIEPGRRDLTAIGKDIAAQAARDSADHAGH